MPFSGIGCDDNGDHSAGDDEDLLSLCVDLDGAGTGGSGWFLFGNDMNWSLSPPACDTNCSRI